MVICTMNIYYFSFLSMDAPIVFIFSFFYVDMFLAQ